MEDAKSDTGKTELRLPCGCVREVIVRQVPAFHDCPGQPEHGTPKLDPETGAFLMEDQEDIQDRHCGQHTAVLMEKQQQIQKALAGGATYDDCMKILAGAEPFAFLGDGSETVEGE